MNRRAFLIVALIAAACSKHEAATERCARCGMKMTPKNPFEAQIVLPDGSTKLYDSPRCALSSLRDAKAPVTGTLRVREFYDTAWRSGDAVVFVAGSDVKGPMGDDFIPVDPDHSTKFLTDHKATKVYKLGEITPQILAD